MFDMNEFPVHVLEMSWKEFEEVFLAEQADQRAIWTDCGMSGSAIELACEATMQRMQERGET
jgi:hypothetical protein